MKRSQTLGVSAALSLLAVTSACENAVTVSGTITLPLDVQQLFSLEQPGRLDLWGTKLNRGAPLPYLCAATDGPRMIAYQFTAFGCAEEQEIQVRAFPVTPEHLDEVRCGEVAVGSASGLVGEEIAFGTTTIFPGRKGGACESASAVADVTLTPTN
jgi:hypothetical protein